MDIDKIFNAIWEGKEWIFSGIGVVALGFIRKCIIGKKSGENSDTYTVKSNEYSCAVTPQVRQTGNRLSGLAGTAYASLLT